MKRLLDIAFGTVALILTSPLFGFCAILILSWDGGPILYRSTRMGLEGRPFQMLKFRTMIQNAERVGGTSTSVDDPRITKIGKLLRKYKLDELPQLLNVLKGEMSMVGPRPEVPGYVELYSEEERLILTVPPGLTDWATLWNVDEGNVLAGSSDPDKMYLESIRPIKIRLQLEYVRNRSLWTDVKILVQTMLVILCGIKPRVMMTVTGQG